MQHELEPYVTIKDLIADKTFPIGRNSLYKLVESGKIRSRQIGNKWLLLPSEVWEDIRRLGKETIRSVPTSRQRR